MSIDINNYPTYRSGSSASSSELQRIWGQINTNTEAIAVLEENKKDKATTIAGYGITDAKIVNGVITLGSNTITPVTDVSGKADKANTLAGYGITDGVTSSTYNAKMSSLDSSISTLNTYKDSLGLSVVNGVVCQTFNV